MAQIEDNQLLEVAAWLGPPGPPTPLCLIQPHNSGKPILAGIAIKHIKEKAQMADHWLLGDPVPVTCFYWPPPTPLFETRPHEAQLQTRYQSLLDSLYVKFVLPRCFGCDPKEWLSSREILVR